jgi:hypothetical protein
MSGSTAHWATPHMVEDILADARRPGLAEPTAIHVRSALHLRLLREPGAPVVVDEQRGDSALDGIALVVDDDLPAFPGYEIHRAYSPVRGAAA